jgi:hypothetical protein
MAAWRPQNRSNRENQKKALGVLPKGILTPGGYETCLANGQWRTPHHCHSSPCRGELKSDVFRSDRSKHRLLRHHACKFLIAKFHPWNDTTHFVYITGYRVNYQDHRQTSSNQNPVLMCMSQILPQEHIIYFGRIYTIQGRSAPLNSKAVENT